MFYGALGSCVAGRTAGRYAGFGFTRWVEPGETRGVTGPRSRDTVSGSEESRFEPWRGNQKADGDVGFFLAPSGFSPRAGGAGASDRTPPHRDRVSVSRQGSAVTTGSALEIDPRPLQALFIAQTGPSGYAGKASAAGRAPQPSSKWLGQ